MIALAVLAGIGLGTGVWALLVGLRPPRPPLSRALAPTRGRPGPPGPASRGGWLDRCGALAVPVLTALGLPTPATSRDLRLLGRSPETHLASKATLAILGLLSPVLAHALLLTVGAPPPWPLTSLAALGTTMTGFLAPDLDTRRRAAAFRDSARHALTAYLSLVRITLAAGAGVEQALWDAASVGTGPLLDHIRHALTTARLTRTTPWSALTRLGEDLGLAELTELGVSMQLAGTEGAAVRAGLAAQADAALTRHISAEEAAAHAATERMALPLVLLAAGFLLFLGWPTLTAVLAAF